MTLKKTGWDQAEIKLRTSWDLKKKLENFEKISKNKKIFWKNWKNWKIWKNLKKFEKFEKIWKIWKNLKNLKKFEKFEKFWKKLPKY